MREVGPGFFPVEYVPDIFGRDLKKFPNANIKLHI